MSPSSCPSWQCIYGRGCQGVLTGPAPELAQGCCSYGAHFTDDDDADRVEAAARTLAGRCRGNCGAADGAA